MNISHLHDPEYKNAIHIFLNFVEKCERRHQKNGLPIMWYRGQTRNWPLLPAIMRQDVVDSCHSYRVCRRTALFDKERLLLDHFRREGSVMVDRPMTNKEWYYLARHNGLPSRLLDWTADPRTALWMAIQKNITEDDEHDGYIYAINPRRYEGERKDKIKKIEQDYYTRIFDDTPLTPGCVDSWNGDVFSIFPDFYNNRQGAQTSRFTLHLPDFSQRSASDEDVHTFYPAKSEIKTETILTIEAKYKPLLRTFLTTTGLRRWHIYPDLENLAKGLKDELC